MQHFAKEISAFLRAKFQVWYSGNAADRIRTIDPDPYLGLGRSIVIFSYPSDNGWLSFRKPDIRYPTDSAFFYWKKIVGKKSREKTKGKISEVS